MNYRTLSLLAMTMIGATIQGRSEIVTWAAAVGTTTAVTNVIGPNQFAEVLSYKLDSLGQISLTSGESTVSFGLATVQNSPPKISGPATLVFRQNSGAGGSGNYVTLKITEKDAQFTPSTAVVIPTDVTGPVEIILESSTDLVNWTRADAGIYGPDTEKRFFRVRAVKQ